MLEGNGPPAPLSGSVVVTTRDGEAVLVLAGAVDLAVVRAFEETGPDLAAVRSIDAGDVTVLSATAAGLLLRVLRSARGAGRTVVLRRSNAHVDRVLGLLELGEVFPRAD